MFMFDFTVVLLLKSNFQKESLITAFGSAKGNRLVSASQRNALVLQKQTGQDVVKAIETADFSALDMMEAVLGLG